MAVRQKLASLGDLVGRGEILRMYGVTIEDLELLDLVETELRPETSDDAGVVRENNG